MLRSLLILGAVFVAALLFGPADHTARAQTPPKVVILLHGFNGSPTNFSTAKAAAEAQGYKVYVPKLPYAGWSAGDTAKNAAFLQQYMTQNGITSAKLDGHSLGGWLAMYMALVVRDARVSSVVLRDTGTGCFWGIPPDQCPGSTLLNQLAAAPYSAVPILNLNHLSTLHPQVDCTVVFNLSHDAFRTDARVNAAAIGWSGVNPCG